MTMTATIHETGVSATVTMAPLLAAAKAMASVIGRKSIQPILAAVRIEVDERGVILSATSLERWAVTRIDQAQVQSVGAICVDAKTLVDGLSGIVSEVVEMKMNYADRGLEFRSDYSSFLLPTAGPEKFPAIPARPDDAPTLTMSGDALAAMLDRVSFIASDAAEATQGMHLTVTKGKACAVSSNTRSAANLNFDTTGDDLNGMIPLTFVPVLKAMAAEAGEDEVSLAVTKNQVFASYGDSQFGSVLLESRLPDYSVMWNMALAHRFTIGASDLADAVTHVSKVAGADLGMYPYAILECGKHGVRVLSRGPNGTADWVIPCRYEGDDARVKIKAAYLVAGIRAAKSDDVSIAFGGRGQPFIIKASKPDGWRMGISPINE